MLERGFLRKERSGEVSAVALPGKRISFTRRYDRRRLPVYSGIALVVVFVVLILVFFGRPFVGTLTIGVFAGVISIYSGLLFNGVFKNKRQRERY